MRIWHGMIVVLIVALVLAMIRAPDSRLIVAILLVLIVPDVVVIYWCGRTLGRLASDPSRLAALVCWLLSGVIVAMPIISLILFFIFMLIFDDD